MSSTLLNLYNLQSVRIFSGNVSVAAFIQAVSVYFQVLMTESKHIHGIEPV